MNIFEALGKVPWWQIVLYIIGVRLLADVLEELFKLMGLWP